MFKAVKGYEGFYEVNELGEVRSVDRIVELRNGGTRKCKGRVLKLKMDGGGYPVVDLSKNNVAKTRQVHRLVAETFIPNPDNLPQIHHKNHVRTDNRVENLQWVTRAEQMDEHWTKAQSKAKGTRVRVVGNGIDKTFISTREAARELGISQSYVSGVANGKYKQAKGYRICVA